MFVHLYLPVPGHQIQGSEILRSRQQVEHVVNSWQWEHFHLDHGVQAAVVDAKTECLILLLDQYNRACPWTARWLNHTIFKHVLYHLCDLSPQGKRNSPRVLPDRRMVTSLME